MKRTVENLISYRNIRFLVVLNVALLIAIKAAFPLLSHQLATTLEQVSIFDSREIITETNRVRGENNLTPLRPNAQLDAAASEKLADMENQNYFAHISPQGTAPWFWIEKNGYDYSHAGENLALGFFNAKDTLSGWMNSPSHRANIININYDEIGVATSKATINGTNGILVVQMFGKSIAKQSAISQPIPTISPVTPTKPTMSPIAPSNDSIAGLKTQNGSQNEKREPTRLQYVSTDSNIAAVSIPSESTNSSRLPIKLSALYQSYVLITLILLMVITLFMGLRKNLVLAIAVNLFLLLASELVPTAIVTTKSMIF